MGVLNLMHKCFHTYWTPDIKHQYIVHHIEQKHSYQMYLKDIEYAKFNGQLSTHLSFKWI